MGIRIDMEGVTTGGITPLDPGEYEAVIAKVVYHASSQASGKPYIEVEFSLPANNRKAWTNFSLQPQSLWALKQFLQRVGYDVPEGELDLEPGELIGLDCRIVLDLEPDYRGRTDAEGNILMQNVVKEVLAA